MSPTQTIVLITGANSGIGHAAATQLAQDHAYHVIIGSRNPTAGESAAKALKADGHSASSVQLDVTSDTSISTALDTISRDFGVLDVLINNAGVLLDRDPADMQQPTKLSTRALFTQTFNANLIGAACLTEASLPLLRKSALPRVIFVSSRMGSLTESLNKSTPYYSTDYKAYDASKAAVNMLAVNYARILEGWGQGGMSNAVCPGLVKTKLIGYSQYGASTDMGAKRIVELARAQKGGPTGTYSDREGGIPW